MRTESGIEDDLSMRQDVRGLAVVDHGRRHQAKTRVVVLMVVPAEERLAAGLTVAPRGSAAARVG